jgi:hypothetical protein
MLGRSYPLNPNIAIPKPPTTGRFLQKKGTFYLHDVQLLYTPRVLGGRIRAYAGTQVRLANQSRSKSSTSSLNSRSSSSSAIFTF